MANSMEIVNYRPTWQVLRVSCLLENNPYGGMTTVQGADDALNRMNNYIEDVNLKPTPQYVSEMIDRMGLSLYEEEAVRIFQVHGFLQATINGLVSQPSLPHIKTIKDYNNALKPKLNLHVVQLVANRWDWSVVRFELEELWRRERSWFIAIDADMYQRIVEKDKGSADMMNFVGIMREVNSVGQ